LFAHMDDDLGRPGRIITTPVAFGRRRTGKKIGQPLRTGRKFLCEICAAAEENYKANPGKDWDDLPALHSTADASHIVRECNGQRQCKIMANRHANAAISMPLPRLPERQMLCSNHSQSSGFDAARGWNTLG
jgi:hypothetical protein